MSSSSQKEYDLKVARLELRNAESRLREALHNLSVGSRKSYAEINEAKAALDRTKADAEIEVKRLSEDVERCRVQVEMDRENVAFAEGNLERGFEK